VPFELAWDSAPAAEVELAVTDSQGTALFRSRGRLDSHSGQCRLLLPSRDARAVEVVLRGSGYGIARRARLSEQAGSVRLDLAADAPTSFELRTGAGGVEDAAVRLYRVGRDCSEETVLADCRIERGRSEPVPLPAGLYYYRAETTEVDGLVCGLVRVDGRLHELTVLEWDGVAPPQGLEAGRASARLVVDSVGAMQLTGVPAFLRTFEVKLADRLGPAPLSSQECSWVVE
jgi:hypothetical protein